MIIICYSILEASHGYQTAMIIYFGGGISGAIFGDLCNMNNVIPYSETFSSIYACIGCLIGVNFVQVLVYHNLLVKVRWIGRYEMPYCMLCGPNYNICFNVYTGIQANTILRQSRLIGRVLGWDVFGYDIYLSSTTWRL
ncbi:hypothetical protein FGO68_gene1865 [Halteria grandinella]|uniref:Rhomboid-like protein n=1 Tax=Halteria grandinella TaxID=5974 RepID=A0A8J8NG41_HALGN|nr:hypothetical protein FGO68_gene1865 [Halteria grandinella]